MLLQKSPQGCHSTSPSSNICSQVTLKAFVNLNFLTSNFSLAYGIFLSGNILNHLLLLSCSPLPPRSRVPCGCQRGCLNEAGLVMTKGDTFSITYSRSHLCTIFPTFRVHECRPSYILHDVPPKAPLNRHSALQAFYGIFHLTNKRFNQLAPESTRVFTQVLLDIQLHGHCRRTPSSTASRWRCWRRRRRAGTPTLR